MPAPTKPLDDLADDELVKITLSLAVGTLRGLDRILDGEPDLQSRSAVVRKLVREHERRRKRR